MLNLFKKPFLSVAFLGTLSMGSLSQAADLGPISAEYAQAKDLLARIKSVTQPGRFTATRLHVLSEDQALPVKGLVRQFKRTTLHLTGALNDELYSRRVSPPQSDVQNFAALFAGAQQLISGSVELSIVYRDENILGRFGSGTPVFETKPVLAEATPFDFTNGFAHLCKSEWKSGLVAHRNPKTGEIQWISDWQSGVAITGVDANGNAQTQSSWKEGLSSAFNPLTGAYESFNGGWKTASASVFNPAKKAVEARRGDWKSGIAGVYNPLTEQVEWASPQWQSGVAGYFDPDQKRVFWVTEWKSGVACIWRINGEYFTSAGFSGGSDK